MLRLISPLIIAFLGLSSAWSSASDPAVRDNKILVELAEKLRNSQLVPDWKIPDHYIIQNGDRLNDIIDAHLQYLPINRDIMKKVIVEINPHAFKRDNPNWMFRGARLKLPKVEDVERVIFSRNPPEKKDPAKDPNNWIHFP